MPHDEHSNRDAMRESQASRLIQDNDGHWYMIPWDMAGEFDRLLHEDEEEIEYQDWVERIDNPGRVKIYEWEEV